MQDMSARSSFYHPAYDFRSVGRGSDTVSRNKLTIPGIIDEAEFNDRIGELNNVQGLREMTTKVRVFDIRDKLPVFIKKGRGVTVIRTENIKAVHGSDSMKHVVPAFSVWDGIPEKEWPSIYENYAYIGVSDGDADIEKSNSPVATVDGKRGFAIMLEGMKTYNYMGRDPVVPGDPMMWIHGHDKEGLLKISSRLIDKSNQTPGYLIPASRQNLRYMASTVYSELVGNEMGDRSYTALQKAGDGQPMTPIQKMALAEYNYLLSGACAGFELAYQQRKLAWLGDIGFTQAQVNAALTIAQKLGVGNTDVAADVATFKAAKDTPNKLAGSNVSTEFSDFIGFTGDKAGVHKEFVYNLFPGQYKNFDDKSTDVEYFARRKAIPELAYVYRFHHLAHLMSRIVGHAASYATTGDRLDIVYRNYKLAASFSL